MSPVSSSYTLASKIRETAQSELFRAHRTADGAPVMLKMPRGEYPTPVQVARLKHEHALLRSLQAPGVVKALGFERIGDSVALVLEDVGDRSLDRTSGGKRLELRAFLRAAISMAAVVESVHRHQIIHKDIKPHHFFEATEGSLKLVDFGLATRLSHQAQRATNVSLLEGTLAYMSPEQTGRMNRALDKRSDLYSLGVTLYELLTGVLPFQTQDPLELVHSHLALRPVPPHELTADVPRALSDVVMKLLSKVAEDRYQDAAGLRADLERCLALAEAGVAIAPFPLGARDFSDELRIPQKLYGRAADVGALLESFDRVRRGGTELLLVSGYSGIGKSALVSELHRQLLRGGRFVAGKFDQLGRSVPYAPIAAACRDLVRSILTESAQALAAWRDRILTAVGPNGRVLLGLVPELELVIGPQPEMQELGPNERQNRFELVFQNFLRAFASPDQPLAFFLDDLQWADPASLRLIHLVLTNRRTPHLLVIGAYRDNEVDPVHPLTLALAELRKAGAAVTGIELRALGLDDVRQLLADTFGCPRGDVEPLAALVLRKTHGNPFFVGQFLSALHEDKLLAFDAGARAWRWDLERIEQTMVTDNVVEFMVGKLRRLPAATRRLLELAACIGHQFDYATLAIVAAQPVGRVVADLWEALREGLLVPLDAGDGYVHDPLGPEPAEGAGEEPAGGSCRFLHDRVQQAAYALIDDDRKREVHLRIGRLMLASAGGEMRSELFAVVNHLDLGAALITDGEERRTLARLNLTAARRARDAAAHRTAASLCATCIELLGPTAWDDAYDMALPAHLTRAECELVGTNVDEALRLLDEVDRRARTTLDRAAARELRTVVLTTANRVKEAAACGIEAARLLGMDVPQDPAALGAAIGAEFGALAAALNGRAVESLVDLPRMTDPETLALLNILYKTCPSINQSSPELMGLIVPTAVNLALRHGNAPVSSYFYACYGMVLAIMGEFEAAYRLGQLALGLNARLQNRAIDGANHFVFAAFISQFRKHASESLAYMQRGLKASLDGGDYIHAGYCASHYVTYRICKGDNLEEIRGELPGWFELLERTGDVINSRALVLARQMIASLRGETRARGSLSSDGFDEEQMRQTIAGSGNRYLISMFHLYRGIARYLAGDLGGATDDLGVAAPALIPCNALTNHHRYYGALVLAARLRGAPAEQQPQLLEALRAEEKVLESWAASAPGNFAHRHALVAAERASVTDTISVALDHYDRAIALARENGFVFDEALANELAGRLFQRRGRKRIARAYLMDAHAAYQRCGATAKAQELDLDAGSGAATGATSDTQAVRAGELDALTVIKASQAMSTEIVLPRLVQSLMRIMIQHAGAQRGYLMLVRDGALWVEAAAGAGIDARGVFQRFQLDPAAPAGGAILPQTILGYVRRTKEKVLLADAAEAGMFAADPYLAERRPRSLLCLPMVRQGELVGVLYLENSLAGDTFSPDRVAILEVLSAQAAISLENATLYDEMEKRVEQRTRELIEAERKAAVAHYEREMTIARQIQTSILPKHLEVAGLEIAARMITASEVGGDYYDLQPTPDGGCWLGVGDVSGHGLDAGLIMLMIQSGLGALMRIESFTEPATLLRLLNRLLNDNVRVRLGRDEFATMVLLRIHPDGRVLMAGAHEDLLVWRAADARCEPVPTAGTWLGISERVDRLLQNGEQRLGRGDVMVLYTDGLTEARNAEGEQFGFPRMAAILERLHDAPAEAIADRLLHAVREWEGGRAQDDDQTVVVVRHRGA